MVKTKCAYDIAEVSDGERILVTRYWPRGLSRERLSTTEWLRSLAPSRELLFDWKKKKISWDEFIIRYNQEMLQQQTAIHNLAIRARSTITLLCFEHEDDPCCHRHLLKKTYRTRATGIAANLLRPLDYGFEIEFCKCLSIND